ncbi:MAG: hypothetical protein ACI9KE_004392 [Polyangiales bacterium]
MPAGGAGTGSEADTDHMVAVLAMGDSLLLKAGAGKEATRAFSTVTDTAALICQRVALLAEDGCDHLPLSTPLVVDDLHDGLAPLVSETAAVSVGSGRTMLSKKTHSLAGLFPHVAAFQSHFVRRFSPVTCCRTALMGSELITVG